MITSTIISMLVGGLGPFFKRLLEFWQDKTDKAHELALMDKQIQAQKETGKMRLEEVQISSDAQAMIARIEAQSNPTGIAWVDAISSTVRPIVTYGLFGLFAMVKTAHLCIAVMAVREGGATIADAIPMVWDEPTQALFAGVMAFWFSDRVLLKKK